MSSTLEILKFNLQERQFPYFEEEELKLLLESNDNDVKKATHKGLLMKAQNDSIKLGPITTASNKEYWEKLAEEFKPKPNYINSMKRADGN